MYTLVNYNLRLCIDRGLSKFGYNATQRLYWLLLTKCDLNSERVLSEPNIFVREICEVFGESGGRSIERAITKEIKDMLGLQLSECRDLQTAISSAGKLLSIEHT
jgi:hypothetical protein